MKRLVMIVAVALAVSACGNDDEQQGQGDGDSIDEPQADTFTAFVIDLVKNRTANDTDAVNSAAFKSLPDPDVDNESAYSSLFE